ncbi:hypothetical protein ScPMuIL_014117 [Solemya velum]
MAATGKWVGLFLSILCFWTCIKINSSKYQQVEIEILSEPSGEPSRIFTDDQIAEYDGTDDSKPLLMAVRGVVFDVSKGKEFYGKGSGYHMLAGKDCTRAIAMWSLEKKDCTHNLDGLSDDTLKSLDEVYLGTYKKKYPIVGYMDYLLEKYADKFQDRFKEDL